MEYIDGDTLSNLRAAKEQKVFQPEEIATWTSQLCDRLLFPSFTQFSLMYVKILFILFLSFSAALAVPAASVPDVIGQGLAIAPSSTRVFSGTAYLSFSSLSFKASKSSGNLGVYSGTYKLTVTPYPWENQTGTCDVVVSQTDTSKLQSGKPASFSGKATSLKGSVRSVSGMLYPKQVSDASKGDVVFIVDSNKGKIEFKSSYQFR